MLCPNCSEPLVLTDQMVGRIECTLCKRIWTSDTLAFDVSTAASGVVSGSAFPGDAIECSSICSGCSGNGEVEQHIDPSDPSQGFNVVSCPACGGLGRL